VRVLIADDHDILRRAVRLLVTGLNIEVCGEASNGYDAIAKAQELKPDTVIMDLVMPDLDGLQATRQIRRLLPDTQIVFLSQHDIPQARDEAFKAGATSYVSKSSLWKLILILKNVRLSEDALERPGLIRSLPDPAPRFGAGSFGVQTGVVDGQPLTQILAQSTDPPVASQDLALMTNLVPTGMTCCSRDLRYLWANAEYGRLLERPLDKIVGRRIVDVLGKEAFRKLTPHFEQVLSGVKVAYEAEVDFEGVGLRHISAFYRPTFDGARYADGWFAFIRDLTQKM